MSNNSPADPATATLARFAERDAREAHAERGIQVENLRRDLLIRTFAEPVGTAVEPWRREWTTFANALRGDRRAEAAAHLRNLAGQLQTLHRYWGTAWEGLREWRRTHAEPWKADSPEPRAECSSYGEGWPNHTTAIGEHRFPEYCRWQMSLPWLGCGPAPVPDTVTNCDLFAQAERLDNDGLFLDLRAVFDSLSLPDQAHELASVLSRKSARKPS